MYRNSSPLYFTDFTKTVLEWDFETLSKPLAIAISRMPLPKTMDNINEYYHNFLPFILEEARAIIANGLERVKEHTHDAQAFNLRLKKQAHLPKTKGNPMSLYFNGTIPNDIEHGNSMNVLLLKTIGTPSTKGLIALATEKPDTSELFAKIIMASADYHEYQQCFTEGSRWKAHYLGSIISEQRMYDACLEATDCACVQQIAKSKIPIPTTIPVQKKLCGMDHLNLSQEEAIYAFLNAKEGSTLLLQGPPGTGKTTTLITLLKQAAKPGTRTMVSAHSNKGVQVLALRAIDEMPNVPMILIGVASKLPEKLRPIFLQDWHFITLSAFSSHHQQIESLANTAMLGTFANALLSNIEQNIRLAEQRLNNFTLIHSRELSDIQKQELYALNNDPLLRSDFRGFYDNIAQLKLQPHSKPLWNMLLSILNRCIGKWKSIKKEDLEEYLLNHAGIIFSTLISAGRKNMLTMAPVDYLLVDEAAQSVEAATLIPMRFQPSKILLVGDTKQLPATVISSYLDDSDRHYSTHYKWSMMWRLIEENKQASLMLDIQYRMHPHICQWPSEQYYENRLITAPKILPMSTLNNTDLTSRPYAIYQISGQVTSHNGSNSAYNIQEAEYVLKIIQHIRLKNGTSSIGIITPYAEQKRLITEKISKKHLQKFVDINTVDGFQGDERDIIIISFTRTHVSEFLKEVRRLNVAITRAKFCLIILAAPGLLSDDIGQLITDAKLRQVLYSQRDLNRILQTGAVAAAQQESKESTELRTMAWQGKSDAQLQYAKTFSDKSQAILWYRRAAENNNAEAQYYIGQIYLSGNEIIKKDIQLGIAWLNKSAQQNFPSTQFLLGKYCILGNVVVKNVALGIDYCERAASSHLLDAIVFLAKLYDEGQEVIRQAKLAEKYYRLAAKQDHTKSIEKLAALLSVGTLENQSESLAWYQKIAVRKVTTAYYPLANLLHRVFNKQTEANHWYLKAAEQDNPKAQYELGLRFKNGTYGCSIDIERSNYFFQQAAHAGHVDSQFIYAGILKKQGKLEFMRFFELAANQGHIESQYEFALLLSSQDKHLAYKYYFKAAQQNHLLAQQACIHYQIQFNCDLKTCLAFCEKLAMHENSQAQFLLARILDTGLVGTINKSRAYHYYTLLAKNGHALAQYHCAILLESNTDVNCDLVTARLYYESCIEHCFEARLRLACLLLKEIDRDPSKTPLIYSEQKQKNVLDHEQDQKTTAELYQKPIELLEYYFKHCPRDKSLVNTIEQYLENLILNTRATHSVYDLGVINTRSAHANYLLGRIFEEGIGVIVNVTRALQHYQLASTQHPDASYRAGYIYESGLGVSKNSAYAKTYYKNAANKGHELAAKRLTWSYWLSTKKDNVPNDETLKKAESHNCAMM